MVHLSPGAVLRSSFGQAESNEQRTEGKECRHRRLALCLMLSALCSLAVASSAQAQLGNIEQLSGRSIIPFSQADEQPGGPEKLTVDVVEKGTSSRRQRRDALEQLPLKDLSPVARAEAEAVLDSLSLYRRLPTLRVDVDPRAYDFFAQHPDVAVSIWRAMQISRVQLRRNGPAEFETDTLDGTCGKVTILHSSADGQLVLCDGQFQSPALPKAIRAVALLHLQCKSAIEKDGAPSVTHSVDMFVSFPSQAVETIARIVSPVSYHIADRNFEEISLFLEMMQIAMNRQPGWVEHIAAKLDGINADERQQLLSVTAAVYIDAQRRFLQQQGIPVSLETIQPPVQRR